MSEFSGYCPLCSYVSVPLPTNTVLVCAFAAGSAHARDPKAVDLCADHRAQAEVALGRIQQGAKGER